MAQSSLGNGNGKPPMIPAEPVGSEDREFWLAMRQSFLMMVDSIETRVLRIKPTTADIRRWYREAVKEATLPKSG